MALIALRSPQYKYITIPASGVLSTKCTITIAGTLRYTLVKNVSPSTGCNFDISELVRDYLTILYSNTYSVTTIAIVTVLQNYSSLNAGSGDEVGSAVTYTDTGFEAYGEFLEQSNPTIPFRAKPSWLIASQNLSASESFEIFVPTGISGYVPFVRGNDTIGSIAYNTTDTTKTEDGVALTITRIDCTKYGDGVKAIFINRYGVQQDLWFFLKQVKSLNRTNESFQANIIEYPDDEAAIYDIKKHAKKVFNTQASQSHKLSSGYYPEFANQYFEELLLSEYVWLELPRKENPTLTFVVPVKVKTSSMTFKTSVNDRLIEYTIDFEEAFDHIQNVR
mgnify:CR=1 FL=1|tara:strand:- start:249 stop:1253 length:1005 start_codon:yes stop_codon:yes gene_type:complete